jgi:ubiquinone/menaquinone biosynthesis C-methylase UbiE
LKALPAASSRSVPATALQALAELRRVLRPGGELRFYEHVRAQNPVAAGAQRVFDLIWPLIAGGCQTSRDTLAAIEKAGFEIETCERFLFKPFPLALPTAPHIRGIARSPTTP